MMINSLYHEAVKIVLSEQRASASFLQRMLNISYDDARGLLQRMEKEGIVSPANHVGKREILKIQTEVGE